MRMGMPVGSHAAPNWHPTLDLRFTTDTDAELAAKGVTFSRGSTKCYWDKYGILQQAAADEWPIEYDASEERKNILAWSVWDGEVGSQTVPGHGWYYVGAASGNGGVLPAEVIDGWTVTPFRHQRNTDDGYKGFAPASGFTSQIHNNGTYTVSIYIRRIEGVEPCALYLWNGGALYTFKIADKTEIQAAPAGTWVRYSATGTWNSNPPKYWSFITQTEAESAGHGMDVALPMIELGSSLSPFTDSPLTPLGRTVEGARTNLVTNSESDGATLGVIGSGGAYPTNWLSVPNGITAEVLRTGTEDGLPYIDINFLGTPYAAECRLFPEVSAGISAVQNDTVAFSWYARLIDGTAPDDIHLRVRERDSGLAVTSDRESDSLDLSAASLREARHEFVTTLQDATTLYAQVEMLFDVTNGNSYDFTLRIACPQLENITDDGGSEAATSPILTSGTAATRAADNPRVEGDAFTSLWNADAGSFTAEIYSIPYTSLAARLVGYKAETQERSILTTNSGPHNFASWFGSAALSTENRAGCFGEGVLSKVAMSHGPAGRSIVEDGRDIYSDAETLSDVDKFSIGRAVDTVSGSHRAIHGYYQRLRYWNRRLPNAMLVRETL